MGRPQTESTKEKLRQARLGKKLSPETRAKMAEAHKGKSHPHAPSFTGKQHTEDAKKKMSAIRKGRNLTAATKEKMSAARKGVAKSAATKEKMSRQRRDKDSPANKARSEAASRSNVKRNLSGKDFNVKGYHTSPKALNSPVAYRSVGIELRLMQELDADPRVQSWESPLTIRYRDTRNVGKHALPDFLVTYMDGTQRVIEGKGPHLLNRYLQGEKFTAVQDWCRQNNCFFAVATTTNRNRDITWFHVL